ncbi:hypothetical protein A3Q56_00400 [Intoshia linei]|uniref:RRM domain-containing protein n=1 Tax=Intoshia linei TaxID=1819745 RepID=A0A177BCC3_9BILA|nr:hypothetical protein A3Q56_00400 [Intoshia linei]
MALSRIYIGKIPHDTTERDIENMFKDYGRIKDIAIKSGFCFVDYNDHRDAEDAVRECDGRRFMGERIRVEVARGTPHGMDYQKDLERGVRVSPEKRNSGGGSYGHNNYHNNNNYHHRDNYRGGGGGGGGGFRGGFRNEYKRRAPAPKYGNRMIVRNLSTRVSWQDLKDFMRKYGEIIFADAHRHREREGVVEFASHSDMKAAIKELDGYEMNGRSLQLEPYEVSRSKSRSRSYSARKRSYSRSRSHSKSHSKSRSRSRSAHRSISRRGSRNGYKNGNSLSKSPRDSFDRDDRDEKPCEKSYSKSDNE